MRQFLKQRFRWVACFLVLSVYSHLAKAEVDWSHNVAKASRSLLRIEVDRAATEGSLPVRTHGSGFVVSRDGLVMTNSHVVAAARALSVKFPDGRLFTATVVDDQPLVDLAILRLDAPPRDLQPLNFAPSAKARIGQPVVALGSPLGYPFSATSGILSAVDRHYSGDGAVFLLQHDAALNPGSSGGPLLNAHGKVLGVNTATPPETQYDIGIGLAVPSDIARNYLQTIAKYGHFEHSAFGIRVRQIGPELAAIYASTPAGLLIEQVLPRSAGANALLQVGDVITSIDGRPLKTMVELARVLWRVAPNSVVALGITRTRSKLAVLITTQPSGKRTTMRPPARLDKVQARPKSLPNYGLRLQDTHLLTGGSAVAVAEVVSLSEAHTAGVQPGDLVLQVNQRSVPDAATATTLLETQTSSSLLLIGRQGGEQQYVLLQRNRAGQTSQDPLGVIL